MGNSMTASKAQDSDETPDPEQMIEQNKEAIDKIHSLVDDLKTVEEHEKTILEDDEPQSRSSAAGAAS
jgi:hypothetical protein